MTNKKCEMCGAESSANAEASHVCSERMLKDRITHLRSLADNLVRFAVTEFAWTFTVDDGVAVKVEFHSQADGPGAIKAKHVKAFAKIFAAVAENYIVEPDEPAV
jgi:hypothetical protein